MTRRRRDPVEIASDIGAKAHDLYSWGSDPLARQALREVAKVNPEMLAWLRDQLLAITQRPVVEPRAFDQAHGLRRNDAEVAADARADQGPMGGPK